MVGVAGGWDSGGGREVASSQRPLARAGSDGHRKPRQTVLI